MSYNLFEGTDDVRASIARLESRARQMLTTTNAHQHQRVVRNAHSVLHASSAVLADSGAAIGGANMMLGGGGGLMGGQQRPIPETSQAATEHFLANTVGFNLQEQQRLLRHIAANRPNVASVASDNSATGAAGGAAGGSNAHYSAVDLEVALAQRRARSMKAAVDDVHRRMADAQRESTEAALECFADEQVNRITELLGLQSLQLLNLQGAASSSIGSSSALAGRNSEERALKMTAFANAVDATPASEWAVTLPNVGIELQGGDITDPLAALWSTAQGIASQQQQANLLLVEGANGNATVVSTDASTLTAVACSRAVLEEKFLLAMFGSVLDAQPIQYDELCRMHPTKVRAIISKYCARTAAGSSSNANASGAAVNDVWYEVFVAMRAGCYDTACLIAQESGKTTLASLIGTVAAAPITMRGADKIRNSSTTVATLWNDAETRANAYRCAVLLLLNGGNFNAADDEGARQLIAVIVERVAVSVEDILWLRLCLIKNVDGAVDDVVGAGGVSGLRRFQSLRELQRTILDDQQNILALVNHDRIRFATVLLHVLLPSTAVRLLLDSGATFVDGVHVAVLFAVSGLLKGHEAEAETDLPRLLRRYSTMLLEVPHRNAINDHPSRAIFQYFVKCDCVSAFEQMCQNEVVATRLFGAADDLQSREGALLHSADPEGSLLLAMENIAQTAVTEGNLRLAVQMLTTLEGLSNACRDSARAARALRSAIQALCTTMSHAIHSSAAAAREVYQQADKLFQFIERKSATDIPICEIDAFRSLRAMLHITICASLGDEESAIATVKSIPFIPTSAAAVESAIRKYRDMVGTDDVATAMPVTCLLVMRLYQSRFHREVTVAQRRGMLDRAQALMLWCRRWPTPPAADVLDTMHTIQQQMAAASA